MTQDEIIDMAQECKLIGMRPHLDGIYSESLETFAKLVAAKEQKKWENQTAVEIHEAVLEERQACAKVCENRPLGTAYDNGTACAAAIRARGEA